MIQVHCGRGKKEMLHVAMCVDLCVQNWLIGSLEHPASLTSRVSIGVVILQREKKGCSLSPLSSASHFHSTNMCYMLLLLSERHL